MKGSVLALMFVGVLITLISACESFPKTNTDPAKNNQISFRKDIQECQEDYPETSTGAHLRQWMGCMKLKGWQ